MEQTTSSPEADRRSETGLARSAGILGLGNIASRVIGLVRESVISGYFGASGELSAFRLAWRVLNMIYDLLVGGMLSAALVPVLSEYTRPERRQELARIVGAILTLVTLVMSVIFLVVELFATPLAGLLADFGDPHLQSVLAVSLRLIGPALILFGLAGAVMGVLYSLRRFSYTAVGASALNVGIVIAVPLLAPAIQIYALPVGVMLGSLLWLAVLAPGLRDLRLRPSAAWEHPAIRRMFRLYVPIALGLIVTQFQIVVDGRWASQTGAQSVSWMAYATTLIQLPLGLIPIAVSQAALPTLSIRASEGNWGGYREVLGRGMRLVLILLVPAAVGLAVLAEPVIRLLFEHGQFTPPDTTMTATALRFYLLGLLFAGVDYLLNYSFYARQNTLTPAVVGVISIGVYFVVAATLRGPLGFLGLVLADSAKQAAHAIIMVALLMGTPGRPRGQGILSTAARAGLAALGMGMVVWGMAGWLAASVTGLQGEIAVVVMCAAVGAGVYVVLLRALGVTEVSALLVTLSRRLRNARGRRK